MNQTRCVHLIISGRVQGVGYRAFTFRHAQALHLDGWVRNLRDGNVEAVVSGSQQDVGRLLAELRRGPLAARVDDIIISEYTGDFQQGFRQLSTA